MRLALEALDPHPESPLETVRAADGSGSTNYLWSAVMDAEPGTKLAIGTEGHFVRNARVEGAKRGVDVVHLAEVPNSWAAGCGCATMSRNDPPHLAGMLDLLRQGKAPDANRVLAGDSVNETTGARDRLQGNERDEIAEPERDEEPAVGDGEPAPEHGKGAGLRCWSRRRRDNRGPIACQPQRFCPCRAIGAGAKRERVVPDEAKLGAPRPA